jgi:hypothetical protein
MLRNTKVVRWSSSVWFYPVSPVGIKKYYLCRIRIQIWLIIFKMLSCLGLPYLFSPFFVLSYFPFWPSQP